MTADTEYQINEHWVWRGSPRSLKKGQMSVAAIVESIVVCLILWILVVIKPELVAPYSLIVAAIAAPLLLMKSPQSIDLGVKMMRRYWRPEHSDTWTGARLYEKVFYAVVYLVVSLLSAEIAYVCLTGRYAAGALWVCVAATLIGTTVGGTIAVSVKNNFTEPRDSQFIVRLPLIMCVIGGVIAVAILQSSLMYVAFSTILSFVLIECVLWSISEKDDQNSYSIGDFFIKAHPVAYIVGFLGSLPYLAGLAIRVLFIRFYATLRHPIVGFRNIPDNWADNLLRVDPFIPAALIPDGELVSEQLSTSAQLKHVRSGGHIFEKPIPILGWALCFLPALIYRWSLKGSFWAWWPMGIYLLLVRPKSSRDAEVNFAKLIISRVNKTIVLVISGTAFFVLFSTPELKKFLPQLSDNSLQNIEKIASLFNEAAPVSTLGMRWWAIMGLAILPTILWYEANGLIALFKKELDERSVYKLSDYNVSIFSRRCERIQFWWVTFIFCMLEAVWWTLIKVGEPRLFHGTPFTSLPF